jgi:class 3 adenylate cyclase
MPPGVCALEHISRARLRDLPASAWTGAQESGSREQCESPTGQRSGTVPDCADVRPPQWEAGNLLHLALADRGVAPVRRSGHDLRGAGRRPAAHTGEEAPVEPSSVKRRLTCILAADAVGYSQQMGRDEEGTIRVLSAHRAIIDGIIAFHQGRIVSTAGDSVIAEFSSAVDSVRCAVEIQEALKTRNDSLPEHRQMRFRIGVNLGDVVVKNDDLLGDGVNVAARLETMAEPGGICISSSVYDQITGKLDLGFQDIGDQSLKNISRPIHVYRVSGAGAPLRLPPATPATPSAQRARSSAPWAIGAVFAVLVGAAIVWQAGLLRFGTADSERKSTVAATSLAPSAAPGPEKSTAPELVAAAKSPQAPPDSDAQRLRAEAEAMKRQAETELARVRADAEAARVARTKAQAETAAARARSESEAATRSAQAPATRSAQPQQEVETKARDTVVSAPVLVASNRNPGTGPGGVARFDGTWNVTITCPKHSDGALGYVYELVAQVKDGVLRAEQGTEGAAGSLRLQGSIQPDGSARLDAKGLTGDPKYNVKSVSSGVPYAYQVEARFEGSRGTGRRLQLRACDLTFTRQP